jgi:hypothetical protein
MIVYFSFSYSQRHAKLFRLLSVEVYMKIVKSLCIDSWYFVSTESIDYGKLFMCESRINSLKYTLTYFVLFIFFWP